MRIASYSMLLKRAKALNRAFLASLLAFAPAARADVPEWLRSAARMSLPAYPAKTNAVILLEEREIRVKETGEVSTVRRLAYKILRSKGREHATFGVAFDSDTKLAFLKAWSISGGQEKEVKEKDAIEMNFTSEGDYSDIRQKFITAPAAVPGSVVGYEYEQRERPTVSQSLWQVQGKEPVCRGRFLLRLPKGWKYRGIWLHHAGPEPRATGENEWTWEVQNVPAIEDEPSSPPLRAVASCLAVSYFLPSESRPVESSWADVARWYAGVASGTRETTPEIRNKVVELTARSSSLLEKVGSLARFVQREVRYVAIEVGMGGYRPRSAGVVLRNRHGDCKDKATLLSAMFKEIGLDSYLVLVNSQRGVVAGEFPSMLNFDHVIVAIPLPADLDAMGLFSKQEHERLGQLLYFDPTDEFTRLGYLPTNLQGSRGLLVTEQGGELVDLPLLPPAVNRLLRTATMTLSTEGTLTGSVQEIYWGEPAAVWRAKYLAGDDVERKRYLDEKFCGAFPGAFVESASGETIENLEKNLALRFRVKAVSYAQKAGNLVLLRPRILGWKGELAGEEGKERKLPFVFEMTTMHTDIFEITLPEGYSAEELPAPADAVFDFGEYHSRAMIEGKLLRYTRNYTIKQPTVPAERIGEVRKFFAVVAADQSAYAVLKPPPSEAAQ
jgi:hypothetical protein